MTIDGADECDLSLTCIKGGGGCHLQEKLIAFCAKRFIIIADNRWANIASLWFEKLSACISFEILQRKKSNKLGQNWKNGIPIEVHPMSYKLVQETIEKMYRGKAELREYSGAKSKAVNIKENTLSFDAGILL